MMLVGEMLEHIILPGERFVAVGHSALEPVYRVWGLMSSKMAFQVRFEVESTRASRVGAAVPSLVFTIDMVAAQCAVSLGLQSLLWLGAYFKSHGRLKAREQISHEVRSASTSFSCSVTGDRSSLGGVPEGKQSDAEKELTLVSASKILEDLLLDSVLIGDSPDGIVDVKCGVQAVELRSGTTSTLRSLLSMLVVGLVVQDKYGA